MTKVEDFINFFWGDNYPDYLVELLSIRVGSEKNFKRALHVCWYDPSLVVSQYYKINPRSSIVNNTVLTEDGLNQSLGMMQDKLCCLEAIAEDGVGAGCANDMDLIL